MDVLESLLEKVEGRRALLERRYRAPPLRVLSDQEIAELRDGSPLGQGGFARVSRAHLGDRAVAVKRYRLPRIIDITEAAELIDRMFLIARAIVVGEDQRLDKELLVLPKGTGYDDLTEDVVVIMDAMDLNGRQYAATLFSAGLPPREVGRRLISLFTQASQGLEHLHEMGYKHRDVKPENLLVRHDADLNPVQVAWSDFDCLGAQPWMPSDGLTERISSQERVLGTPRYLSPPILLGDATYKSASNKEMDNYAFGMLMLDSLLNIPAPENGTGLPTLVETAIEQVGAQRRDRRIPEEAHRLGLDGLERIIVRATDHERGYVRISECRRNLELVAQGQGGKVVRDPKNRRAWAYLQGKTIGRQWDLARYMSRAMIVGMAMTLASLAGTEYTRHAESVARARAHAASTEGVARAASDLAPQQLDDLIAIHAEEFRRELDGHIGEPLRNPAAANVFLEGAFLDHGVQYRTGRDVASGYVMDLLFQLWRTTGETRLLEEYERAAERLQLEREGTYSDEHKTAVGRAAPIIEHLPFLRNGPTRDHLFAFVKEASGMAIRQQCERNAQDRISVLQEELLAPLLEAIATSRHRDTLMAAAPINADSLARIVAAAGSRACEALVAPDGKSFASASLRRGEWVEQRSAHETIPGYAGPPAQQAVLAQDHVALLAGIASRSRTLRALGANVPLELERCMSVLEGYVITHAGEGILPEYLWAPSQPLQMPQEMLATTRLLDYYAREHAWAEYERLLRATLREAWLNHSPNEHEWRGKRFVEADVARFPGFFLMNRGYDESRVGPLTESDARFFRSLAAYRFSRETKEKEEDAEYHGPGSGSHPWVPGTHNRNELDPLDAGLNRGVSSDATPEDDAIIIDAAPSTTAMAKTPTATSRQSIIHLRAYRAHPNVAAGEKNSTTEW